MSRPKSTGHEVGRVQIYDMGMTCPEPVSHSGETNELRVDHQPSYLFTYHFSYKCIVYLFTSI